MMEEKSHKTLKQRVKRDKDAGEAVIKAMQMLDRRAGPNHRRIGSLQSFFEESVEVTCYYVLKGTQPHRSLSNNTA